MEKALLLYRRFNQIMKRLSLILLTFLLAFTSWSQAIKVEVVQNEDGSYEVHRGGQPYYIKGAGGDKKLDELVEIGGNSIRTWGIENAQEILDEAHKKGLTVMMGFWVQHERHGFDYNDFWDRARF